MEYTLDSPGLVSALDELSLWSAPFGLNILERITLRPQIHALDIACGTGFPLLELAMRLGPESQVYGLDPWQAALVRASQKAKEYHINNVSLFRGEAENMPFFTGTFDLLVSNNGLNNVRNIEQALAECYRVARSGAQFVWSMNTDASFEPFYKLFRLSLEQNHCAECLPAVDAHIYAKRRPVDEMHSLTTRAGFRITSLLHDSFNYRFANGTAMLSHAFIRLAFMPSWLEIIPLPKREPVMSALEAALNEMALMQKGLTMPVPFVVFDCEKP